jgi:hypothetical protein
MANQVLKATDVLKKFSAVLRRPIYEAQNFFDDISGLGDLRKAQLEVISVSFF